MRGRRRAVVGPAGPGGAAVPLARRADAARPQDDRPASTPRSTPSRPTCWSSTSRPWPGRPSPSCGASRGRPRPRRRPSWPTPSPTMREGGGVGAGADRRPPRRVGARRRPRRPRRPPLLAPPAAGVHDRRRWPATSRCRRDFAFVGPSITRPPRPHPVPVGVARRTGPSCSCRSGTLNWQDGERFFATGRRRPRRPRRAGRGRGAARHGGHRRRPTCSCGRAVPQLALLARTAAVVTHGGHNTVCEALAHGLPARGGAHPRRPADHRRPGRAGRRRACG